MFELIVKEYKNEKKNFDSLISIGYKYLNKGKHEGACLCIPKREVKNLVEELTKYLS